MRFSSKIKQSIAKFTLKLWPLSEHEPSGKPLNLVDNKILLLFDFSKDNEIISLANKLSNIYIQLVASSTITICNLSNNCGQAENEEIVYFSFNDFDILGMPKLSLNNWIINNEFDILISFVRKENVYCNNLISRIKSEFKAGLFNPNNVKLFDLTIKQKSDNIINQLELFIQYLNKLNINK
ncbi:MAG TPA: hypothetical protein QF480_04665 [Bacteroidales bacterium]|nr:hypothetical protein [Bacteroidales bacterium]